MENKNMNPKWAYGAYKMNNQDLGIGTVYYAENYFTDHGNGDITIFNPNTGAIYTADELKAVVDGAQDGAWDYVMDVPENAVIGISVNGTDTIYWYDAAAAKAILSHTDALLLDGKNGHLKTAASGEDVAVSIG